MEYINKPAMTDDCCYANCYRPGTIHIKNANSDAQWICSYHRNRWNFDRARFLADGRPCSMELL